MDEFLISSIRLKKLIRLLRFRAWCKNRNSEPLHPVRAYKKEELWLDAHICIIRLHGQGFPGLDRRQAGDRCR